MSSKTPAGVSSKLMGLKFMQRAKAKEDMKEKKEGQVKAQQEVLFWSTMLILYQFYSIAVLLCLRQSLQQEIS